MTSVSTTVKAGAALVKPKALKAAAPILDNLGIKQI
jgi:hypothetical protein